MGKPEGIEQWAWDKARPIQSLANVERLEDGILLCSEIARALMAERATERERCAKIAETCELKGVLAPGIADGLSMAGRQIAESIRSQKDDG